MNDEEKKSNNDKLSARFSALAIIVFANIFLNRFSMRNHVQCYRSSHLKMCLLTKIFIYFILTLIFPFPHSLSLSLSTYLFLSLPFESMRALYFFPAVSLLIFMKIFKLEGKRLASLQLEMSCADGNTVKLFSLLLLCQ